MLIIRDLKSLIAKSLFGAFLAVATFVSPPTIGLSGPTILTDEDFLIELYELRGKPALSSLPASPTKWASYNQWLCFDRQNIDVYRMPVKYEGVTKNLPELTGWLGNYMLEISISAGENYDFDAVAQKWNALLDSAKQVCVMAAYLQPLETDSPEISPSLWIISRLKTDNGEWIEDIEKLGR